MKLKFFYFLRQAVSGNFRETFAELNKEPQLITYCFSTGTRTSAFNAVSHGSNFPWTFNKMESC